MRRFDSVPRLQTLNAKGPPALGVWWHQFVEFGASHGRQGSMTDMQDVDDVALNSEDDPVTPPTLAVDQLV